MPAAKSLALGGIVLWWAVVAVWTAARWQDDETFYSTVAGYDRGLVVAHYNLACLYVGTNRDREAVRELETVLTAMFQSRAWREPGTLRSAIAVPAVRVRIRQNEDVPLEPPRRAALVLNYLAWAHLRLMEPRAAEPLFEGAVMLDPSSVEAKTGQGAAAFLLGRYARAAFLLRRILETQPQSPDAHAYLARTLAQIGDWRGARIEARSWQILRPEDPDAPKILVSAQLGLGDRAAARLTLAAALKRWPKDTALLGLLASARAGER